MLTKIKLFLKKITPPFLWKIYKSKTQKYGFFGNYSSWEDAVKDSEGYDSDIILNKVKESLLKVKEGMAVYERDSVLFDKIEYSFPVLATLLKIALENGGKLSVLDFGGSLGSHYFQYRAVLSDIKELRWSIVEQPKFVECGQEFFKNEQLKFFLDVESCWANEKPDVILLSSVLQYLPKPHEFLEYIISYYFKYILVDVTAFFILDFPEKLTVQKVPPEIYSASYPAWIFNKKNFLSYFTDKYDVIANFNSLESPDLAQLNAKLEGFILKKIEI